MIIGPNSPVIFIGPDNDYGLSGLTMGALYFVEDIMDDGEVCFTHGACGMVSLKDGPGFYIWYCTGAFKPLGGTDEEAIAKELETA
jgi:hypothetical protein